MSLPEIISRKEAVARGLKRYFTGKPCKYGHVAERWVSVCKCIECALSEKRAKGQRPREQWLKILGDKLENRRLRSLRYRAKHRKEINRRNSEAVRKSRAALRALSELGIEV